MSRNEMTRQMELNTAATFYNVRVGGPKEKRIRRVELMGEHTLKSLHYIKVTQQVVADVEPLSTDCIRNEFEARVGDVGDAYQPVNEETGELWEFILVGFYSCQHCQEAAVKLNGLVVGDITITVEAIKDWFVGLYPKKSTLKAL